MNTVRVYEYVNTDSHSNSFALLKCHLVKCLERLGMMNMDGDDNGTAV